MTWIVTDAAVTAQTNVGPGRARVDFYRGATLPDDVPAEDIDRLSYLGQITWVDDPQPEPVDPDALVTGTIEAILGWVGDDTERARRALAEETRDGGKHRPTLIPKLEEIIGR